MVKEKKRLQEVVYSRFGVNFMEQTKKQFKVERKKTDDSLTLERGKTDDSFNNGRGDTHDNIDQIISKHRVAADRDKIKRRSVADLKRNSSNIKSNPEKNISEDISLALANQRNSEDIALMGERSDMDAALILERGEKEKLMNRLLIQERKATDKNLLGERATTDTEVERVEVLLNDEHAAHVETKSELTTREEFVAIVSHDLRNPIGAILSSAEILLEDSLINKLDDETKSLIALIKRNAETSLRLISDLLDMERIVEGKLQLHLTKNRMDDLIKETVESFAYAAAAKKIILKTSLSNSTHAVSCDKDRVTQILSNLIGNALKFTPVAGSVTVTAQQSEFEVTLSVSDTGPGIPNNQQNRIFERFAQIGNKQRGGLGLGLYISKTLVESHFGKLWVNSKFGSGSNFSFTLPLP